MLKLKLVQLDDRGNVLNYYPNSTVASKCNNIKQPAISRCCNNISKMIKGEETKNNAIFANGFCYVKLEDWEAHQEKVKWLLEKNDILCINDNGEIEYTFKTVIETYNNFKEKDIPSSKKISIYRVLNDRHQVFEGYRLATKEHYTNKTNENPNYYKEEYGRRKKIILYTKNNGIENHIKEFNTLEEASSYFNCANNTIRYALKRDTKVLKTDYYLKYGSKVPFFTKK